MPIDIEDLRKQLLDQKKLQEAMLSDEQAKIDEAMKRKKELRVKLKETDRMLKALDGRKKKSGDKTKEPTKKGAKKK